MTSSMIDHYVEAATRANTRRSYQSAIRHFEVEWGGFLPATADSIARYLAHFAPTQSASTLRQRLAAIAQWHIDQGFPDPTKAPLVKKVLKGIAELHPVQPKQAKPLQLDALQQLDGWLQREIHGAELAGDRAARLRLQRNRALVLLGFWRGFRSDELGRLCVEHIVVHPDEGMTLFLPHTKTNSGGRGVTFKAPALSRLCPMDAYQQWIALSGLEQGPVFRRIDRWGTIADEALHPNSFIPLLRDLLHQAGIADSDRYSSHSLRRGFATWANANGWDVKALMEYVGWRDVASALKYIEGSDSFAQRRIEAALAPAAVSSVETSSQLNAVLSLSEAPSISTPLVQTALELRFTLEGHHAQVRGEDKARRAIENCCLKQYGMQVLDAADGRYRIVIKHADADELDENVELLIDEMYHIAATHSFLIETTITDPQTQRRWS